jgi:hypothetical protein
MRRPGKLKSEVDAGCNSRIFQSEMKHWAVLVEMLLKRYYP